ncbi:hypothetical protein CBP51_04535 [Cellvibrio mixtus]|uniref:Uncharacterized protein n=1 Tax=Cellvibrio mixtus TaxID=39650 RepID=A0A266QAC9_9GAMM|nr:hypothetical protein CBP51_04535 [Cellvibrio mixtus]
MNIKFFVIAIGVTLSNIAFASLPLGGYVGGTGWVSISKVTASDVVRFEIQGGACAKLRCLLLILGYRAAKNNFQQCWLLRLQVKRFLLRHGWGALQWIRPKIGG